jgi:hypothetical protein
MTDLRIWVWVLYYDRRSVGQSVVERSTHPWGLRPDVFFYCCQTFAGLLMWGALADESTNLSFTIAPGPPQHSNFRVRVPWDSWPYFTVSEPRLPFWSPPTTRKVTVEIFDLASTRQSYKSITCPFIHRYEPNTELYIQQLTLFRIYSLLCKRINSFA